MAKVKENREHIILKDQEIDATGKSLGRISSEIAGLLIGKDGLDFSRNKIPNRKVKIKNASKIEIENKKQEQKKLKSYSGFPSGLKEETLGKFIKRRGISETLKKTVYGMLPKNKLRQRMIKNLIISE